MNNENKEVETELSKLKTDAKVYLILSVGAASFFSLLVINFLLLSINATTSFQNDNFVIGSTLSAILGLGFAVFFAIRMRGKRKEIKEFKKKCVQIKT